MPMDCRNRAQVLDQEFLLTRCRILDVAAALDRLDRAPEPVSLHADHRLGLIRRALECLQQPGPDRSETIQRLFSLEYDAQWQDPKAEPRF